MPVDTEVGAIDLGTGPGPEEPARVEEAGTPAASPSTAGTSAPRAWDGGGNGSPRKRRAQLERK